MEKLFGRLTTIDWTSLAEVSAASREVLRELASDRILLSQLVNQVPADPSLLRMCEHYDLLDKLVLYSDEAHGFRLRLHIFLPGYFDRPHNHRWSYSSLILQGSYQHFIYGQDDGITEDIDVQSLRPKMINTQRAGDFYTLDHSMVHSVIAEPYTVSLIVRGPSIKERFLVMDRKTNEAWWQYGMNNEAPGERELKTMSAERFSEAAIKLTELRII